MGLEGTLRAFSVTDLLQVLGLQRKTGILTIEGKADTITVFFLAGQIVSADSGASSLDERVGTLLVRTGKLAPEWLIRALEVQKETRQQLASILFRDRLLPVEDLREALRLQISRILLPTLGWTEGDFRFNPSARIDHDAGLLLPIPTESLLMEAAMVHDELGVVEEKQINPWLQGLQIGLSFIVGGLIPAIPVLLSLPQVRWWAYGLTALTALVLGTVKARYTRKSAMRAGLEFLAVVTDGTLAGVGIGLLLHAA